MGAPRRIIYPRVLVQGSIIGWFRLRYELCFLSFSHDMLSLEVFTVLAFVRPYLLLGELGCLSSVMLWVVIFSLFWALMSSSLSQYLPALCRVSIHLIGNNVSWFLMLWYICTSISLCSECEFLFSCWVLWLFHHRYLSSMVNRWSWFCLRMMLSCANFQVYLKISPFLCSNSFSSWTLHSTHILELLTPCDVMVLH